VNVDFLVKWKVGDPQDYLFSLLNPEKTIEDVAESVMREVVGRSDYQTVSTSGRAEVEKAVHKATQATLDRYKSGIKVIEVQLLTVDPPREVIDAFRDVQAAKADKDRMQNEAEADRNTKIPTARGLAVKILQDAQAYKEQVIAEAIGRTARFDKVYDEYSKAPEVTRKRMYLETMEAVLGGSNKIVLDDKANGVVPYLPLNELNRGKGGQ
jgi:modulator of FtsH protease HflK